MSGSDADTTGARRASLPPLRQPTGELPQVPDEGPTTLVDRAQADGDGGVFGQSRGGERTGRRSRAGLGPESSAAADRLTSPIPSPFPNLDDQPAAGPPSAPADPFDQTDAADATAAFGVANPGEVPGMDPFNYGDETQSPAMAGARPGRLPSEGTRSMARPGAAGDGVAGGASRAGYERPQDTEFKLATRRERPQKPKEPNRLLLVLGVLFILGVGLAAAWFLTQNGGDETATADQDTAETDEAITPETTVPATPEATAPPEPVVSEPTLFFDAATSGPLQQGETYSIDLVGEAEGSLLQVVVDEIPQGEPDPLLPDLILPAGRHSLFIEITNGTEVTQSAPIELYVLPDPPPAGFRANLS